MNLRILIIEDDPENREGLRILISRKSILLEVRCILPAVWKRHMTFSGKTPWTSCFWISGYPGKTVSAFWNSFGKRNTICVW